MGLVFRRVRHAHSRVHVLLRKGACDRTAADTLGEDYLKELVSRRYWLVLFGLCCPWLCPKESFCVGCAQHGWVISSLSYFTYASSCNASGCALQDCLRAVTVMFWCPTKQRVCLGLLRWKPLAGCPKISPTFPSRHTLTSPCTSTSYEANKPLKHWTLVVNPFSKVRVHLGCNISVRPLDPLAFPESNRAFITVHGTTVDQGIKLDNVHVHYDDQRKELFILSEKVNSNVSVELTAPVKSDLDITTRGEGNVRVQKMECEECKVQTERGSCVLHSVKAHRIQLQSQGGAITGVGTLHGNVDISTSGASAVDLKKIQGTVMKVSTEHGPLKIKALYAESISLASTSGSIQLGHMHGDCTVKTETGNVTVDGSSGHLQVWSNRGDIDAYVGESASAELTSQEGSVCVRVPSSISAGLQLCGASVEVSPEVILQDAKRHSDHNQTTVIGHMNTPAPLRWIRAQAPKGPIRLKTQSWFESLKLGG